MKFTMIAIFLSLAASSYAADQTITTKDTKPATAKTFDPKRESAFSDCMKSAKIEDKKTPTKEQILVVKKCLADKGIQTSEAQPAKK